MKNYSLVFLLIVFTMITSCGKDVDPDGNLEGTWRVEKVEGQQYVMGNPGIYLVDNNPIGTIQFKSAGWGEQDYSFSLFGTTYPQNGAFKYTATESEIVIDVVNGQDMVWQRILNEENVQIASYEIVVNTSSTVTYTLTLEK